MKLLIPIYCLLLVASSSLIKAKDSHTSLTNKAGKTVKVDLQRVSATKITFKLRSTLKEYSMLLSELDEASQQTISDWVATGAGSSSEFEIDFASGEETKSLGKKKVQKVYRTQNYNHGYNADPDIGGDPTVDILVIRDKQEMKLSPEITIKNCDQKLRAYAANVTVVVLGRPTNSRTNIKVLQSTDRKLPVINELSEFCFKTDQHVSTFDRGKAKLGSAYLGYVVLVHREGEILAADSSPKGLAENYARKFLKAKADSVYSDHMVFLRTEVDRK